MLTFLWLLLYNLRIPFTVVAVLGIATAGYVGVVATEMRMIKPVGSIEFDSACWRQLAALQSGIIVALLAAFFWSVPAPDYDVKVVEKPVQVPPLHLVRTEVRYQPRIIKEAVLPSYERFYSECTSQFVNRMDSDTAAQCHRQALEAIDRSDPRKVIVRTITQHDPFAALFKECNDGYNVSKEEQRDARIEVCRKVAATGSTGVL